MPLDRFGFLKRIRYSLERMKANLTSTDQIVCAAKSANNKENTKVGYLRLFGTRGVLEELVCRDSTEAP